MILTDREIQIAVSKEMIKIDPRPAEGQYSSTSVDLTLDPNLSIFKPAKKGLNTIIDPSIDDFNAEEVLVDLTDSLEIPNEGYDLPAGDFILGFTREYIDLRQDTRVAARVEGKSSLARLGISIHITAPHNTCGLQRSHKNRDLQSRQTPSEAQIWDAYLSTYVRIDPRDVCKSLQRPIRRSSPFAHLNFSS